MGLKRKESLRDSYRRRLRENPKKIWLPNGRLKQKKPLKKISRSMRRKLGEYQKVRDAFLAVHRNCQCCEIRRDHGENIVLQPSCSIHHKFGRGSNLCDVRGFVAVCSSCHAFIHGNPSRARELNLLCEPALWNVPIV
jgi:hypothetical protein